MKKHIERLFALIRLGRKMAEENDLHAVFYSITDMCVDVFGCFRASLMLFEKESNDLVLRALSGHKGTDIIDTRQALGEGIAGWAARRREALLLGRKDDSEKYPELDLNNSDITSAMVVPIILREELVGVINVSSHSPETTFDNEDLQALQVFAENTGAFIRHAEQAHWMRQTIKKLRRYRNQASDPPAAGRARKSVVIER
jgi:putative methionine-R-sulfoxide reductase with GAF domain